MLTTPQHLLTLSTFRPVRGLPLHTMFQWCLSLRSFERWISFGIPQRVTTCMVSAASRFDLLAYSDLHSQSIVTTVVCTKPMEDGLVHKHKVPSPSTSADYRPISVVPILSRIVERFIVHAFIYPAFHRPPIAEKIKDQFAFRPTGSTTAAVIDLLQQISTMLQTNEYVAIIHVDYSKAFDTV